MSNLFIIGNGFDLAHHLPTTYNNFRDYLIKEYPEASYDKVIIPEGHMMPDGGTGYGDIEVVSLLLYLICQALEYGDDWSDFEQALGRLPYADCFYDLGVVRDRNGDINLWHIAYNSEDRAAELSGAIRMIKGYFSAWVKTIQIRYGLGLLIKPDFKAMIEPNDLFLTFNYTNTLNILYKVKNVLHIHGKQGENLIFGHSNDDDVGESLSVHYTGAESYISSLHRELRKPTDDVIASHRWFFNRIASEDIQKICFFGFSFSEVDEPYIYEICRAVKDKPSVVCLLNDYVIMSSEKWSTQYN